MKKQAWQRFSSAITSSRDRKSSSSVLMVLFKQVVGEIQDEQGNILDAARHPLQLVKMKVDQPVSYFDMMRKNRLICLV